MTKYKGGSIRINILEYFNEDGTLPELTLQQEDVVKQAVTTLGKTIFIIIPKDFTLNNIPYSKTTAPTSGASVSGQTINGKYIVYIGLGGGPGAIWLGWNLTDNVIHRKVGSL